jgi:hypothetical protein
VEQNTSRDEEGVGHDMRPKDSNQEYTKVKNMILKRIDN